MPLFMLVVINVELLLLRNTASSVGVQSGDMSISMSSAAAHRITCAFRPLLF